MIERVAVVSFVATMAESHPINGTANGNISIPLIFFIVLSLALALALALDDSLSYFALFVNLSTGAAETTTMSLSYSELLIDEGVALLLVFHLYCIAFAVFKAQLQEEDIDEEISEF
ncbi:hypothetical protein T459_04701 [Capsicum annuum]|uniref:Uncharacterized protein n=1 Tax=Capsicum annuum TaxID=4072 RepID=A0A2G3A5U6_CAPAN|nr:hypothetical protein T459_04701 [Capsicum annuum]